MSKNKQNKDFRNMNLVQAMDWTKKNCEMEDVRKRMASRSVAWILLKNLEQIVAYTRALEAELTLKRLNPTEQTNLEIQNEQN